MPKLTASKDEIRGQPLLPEGLYTVRMDGFKPRLSKNKDSVNLQPQMVIVNHSDYNDRHIFDNLNSKAKWIWADFCHAFGVPLGETPTGDVEFPGDFVGPDEDPEKWQYQGPLLGQIGQVYVIQADNNAGGINNRIKFYVCKVPGCSLKHSKDLS